MPGRFFGAPSANIKGSNAQPAANMVANSMRSKAAEKNDQQVEMLETVLQWFHARGWTPFEFQHEVWDAYLAGKSGLIHAPTGIGKTYAAWFGTLIEWMADAHQNSGKQPGECAPLRTLWVTPLRALTTDIAAALLQVVEDMSFRGR